VRAGTLELGGPRPRGRSTLERGGPRPGGAQPSSEADLTRGGIQPGRGGHRGRDCVMRVFRIRGLVCVRIFYEIRWVFPGCLGDP
jgi:hypothetical protein